MSGRILFLILFCSTLSAQDVTVSWHPNTEPDMLSYYVYLGRSSKGYDGKVGTGLDTSRTFNNLYKSHIGDTVYFAVTAMDTAGNESDFSEEVWIWLDPNIFTQPDTSAPRPPDIKRVILEIGRASQDNIIIGNDITAAEEDTTFWKEHPIVQPWEN